MRKKTKKTIALAFAAVITLAFILVGLYSGLTVIKYDIRSAKLPAAFDGYKIALIADLHGYQFGEEQSMLIDAIKTESPDAIILCGDIMDKEKLWKDSVEHLLAGIEGVAQVYAVPGNHEFENPQQFVELLALYDAYGVTYLNGTSERISRSDQHITFYSGRLESDGNGKFWIGSMERAMDADGYSVFLFHFGDQLDTTSKNGYNLILSGHTHGGIVRLFGIGILDNNGGFFPKYAKGVFEKNGTTEVISAGLGDAAMPRFYNRRELVIVTLSCGI